MAHHSARSAAAPDAIDRTLSIAEVCELLGITAHTARYYERIGLIEVARSGSGHRVYDQRAVDRLDFLARMRSSGMGISDLCRYINLVNVGESTAPQRLRIMIDQRQRILARIRELESALAATDFKIAAYGGAAGDDHPHQQSASTATQNGDRS